MPESLKSASAAIIPFSPLLRSRDLRLLWLTRILVNLRGVQCLFDSRHEDTKVRMLDCLRLTDISLATEEDRLTFFRRLSCTLTLMEKRRASYQLQRILRNNLSLLRHHLGLTALECRLLALAVLLRSDELLIEAADSTQTSFDTPKQLSQIIRCPEGRITYAVMASALLRKMGLIQFSSGGTLMRNICCSAAAYAGWCRFS